jgi:predicted nucleic acid-binding protein
VTESDVVLDTWAWWEVFKGSTPGTHIRRRFLGSEKVRAHTSAISVGEISAKLASLGTPGQIDASIGAMRRAGHLHDVTAELARAAGLLRAELRQTDPHASLADGIVLATARRLGARLVSADPAFRGQPDVLSDP